MKKYRLKLESKYILGIFLIGICCFIILGVMIYNRVSEMMINQCKEDAMGLAQVAAREIDGDAFENFTSDEGDEYDEAYAILDKYSNNNLITYIYAMRPRDNHLEFVIDTDKEEPAEYGEYYELLDDMKPALDGVTCADTTLSADKWGAYFSAYSPIMAADGRVVGLVGCDIILGDVEVMLNNLRTLIIVFLGVFAIALVLVYIKISEELMMRDLVTEIPSTDKLYKVADKYKNKGKLNNYAGIQINIKDFRYVNQQFGTEQGDVVLREYASVLAKNTQHKELVVSMGGDAFFALIDKNRVTEFLNQISHIDTLVIAPNVANTGSHIVLNARCGVYLIENDAIREVMNKCALALNQTKKENVDVVLFRESLMDEMIAEKDTLLAYADAIKKEEFKVYYQPKVELENNELDGAEALCRWIKDGTLIRPDSFIPTLEKNGKICELDFYVFEHVCRDIKVWLEAGIKPVRISSNFSKNHLANPEFARMIIDIVNKYDIPVKYLEIELTESSGYSDDIALNAFLTEMRHNGIHTSMDDFGTGYSSLSLLKELDFDVIKIDKSFFRDMADGDSRDLKLIEHVVHMIHDLERTVVCEGIETKEQVEFLRKTGNPLVQGYFFDKPLPHDEFEKRLKNPKYLEV